MATPRGNPLQPAKAQVDTTGMDPEMIATLGGSTTLGKAAAMSMPPQPLKGKALDKAANDSLMEMYNRVDKSRAVKGLPSLPKPGTKEYRQ